jgi:catechol 2,3-dioxygenase-like lactoylglutathione lyase family enzyme
MPVVNHLGLTVMDIEESIKFYRDVVGMELQMKRDPRVMGEWYDTLTENPGQATTISAHLKLGDFTLQLIEYTESRGDAAKLGHNVTGSPHLCVGIVGDFAGVDARHAELEAAGFHVSPVVQPEGLGFRSFYVFDPDGLPVELMCRPPRS